MNYFEKKGELDPTHKKVLTGLLIVGVCLTLVSLVDGVISVATSRHSK